MKSILQSKVLKRAGRILMLILWIESISKTLITFKNNPAILKRFIITGDASEMCKEWLRLNKTWGFEKVIKEFKNHFPEYNHAREHLEEFWVYRDLLSHPQMSPDKSIICMISDASKKKKKDILKKMLGFSIPPGQGIKINLDKNEYRKLLRKLKKFDSQYFPDISKELGINYSAIKWPIS